MPEPSKIPAAWAWDGDINNIPATDPGNGLASWERGYPIETQTPITAGGTPPRRQDMNGALNALSNGLLWYQQGGLWQYDALVDYEVGNHVLQNGSLYYCIAANGPSGTVKSPSADTSETYWKPIIYSNGRHPDPDHLLAPAVLQVLQAVYPVGSIYCSYGSTSPATLFGFGSWTKIEGRFLLGANSTYGLGSTGGAATVTLTINQIPSHNHSASTGGSGGHTHTVTIYTGGDHTHTLTGSTAKAGKHVHTITVNSTNSAHAHTASSNSAGAHTHARGTMEITGSISSADTSEYLIYADNLTVTGAFKVGASQAGKSIGGGSGTVRQSFDFAASRSWTGATSKEGSHSHTITVNSGGTHTHTASSQENGEHDHSVTGTANTNGTHTHTVKVDPVGNHTHSVTVANSGGGQAHDNMPPYLAVNMWRRTA